MTPDSAPPRPWLAAFGIGIVAEILFLANLARPSIMVFDEVHYVSAARVLLGLVRPENTEHPLVGKLIIAAGLALFGDNGFGWRFFSTIAASVVVMGVFAIGWLLLGRIRPALFAALFTLLNFTVYVQARIGMLDGFMAAFVVAAIAVLLAAMHAPAGRVVPRLVLGAVLLGLAAGTKWAAIPFIVYAALAIGMLRWRDALRLGKPASFALGGASQPHFDGVATLPAIALIGGIAIAVYLLTFTPAFFYQHDALKVRDLIPLQGRMYYQQTLPLPVHTYQSAWWTWPLDIRPIWYLYESVDGAVRGILLIGNPVVLWGGLIALLACVIAGLRDRRPALLAIAGLWLASYAMWIVIPKKLGFFYYYYLPSIFIALALAAALDHFGNRYRRLRDADAYVALLAFGMFAYFLPILSAAALPNDQAFLRWMWLPTWP
ncbi:MAG: phospholipid carrier-dependent glycosyltransferase [Sphingomonas sp.]|nr:phospholipid carrier-dependent glycosyltransferase [Sphingomonas sp.]